MVVTTISAVLFVVLFLADAFGLHTNPYIGILSFILLPACFVLGLLLIPFGAWVERRRRRAGKPPTSIEWPRIDLNDPAQRRTAIAVFALTMVNIVIVSLGAYKSVEYMDSVNFCGLVCHTAMKPEFMAHQAGPHANITCAECHVGSSAADAVSAKLAGTRRLAAVARGNYSRPIIAAPEDLVESSDTCEHCHDADRFIGDLTRRKPSFADDEQNSPSMLTLHMHVGGRDRINGARGIHWHADPQTVIEYVATDNARTTIPWVRVSDSKGVREYAVGGATPEGVAGGVRRRMECADCHNRIGHGMPATAEQAVDIGIARGDIAIKLPFVRRESARLLKRGYVSEAEAVAAIDSGLRNFYRSNPTGRASAADLDRTVRSVQEIYRHAVIPEMKVTFGTYVSSVGHMDGPGCFRCHDDDHVTRDGRSIGQDCSTCHDME